MTDWFIPGAWLASISGKTLLYPCGGMDWAEPIDIFSNYVSDFIFSDINYPQGLKLTPATGNDFKLTGSLIEGDPKSTMEGGGRTSFASGTSRLLCSSKDTSVMLMDAPLPSKGDAALVSMLFEICRIALSEFSCIVGIVQARRGRTFSS